MSRFSEIIGQKDAVQHLQNGLETGRITHAYIFAGEEGSGKRALADAFSNALVCRDRKIVNGLLEPCGVCHDCIQAAAGSHPDIKVVTPAKKPENGKKPVLGVDDIRALRSDVAIRPYESDWKIYIIPDAERMTVQAQNALLKTLEEPPAYAVLLLLASTLTGFLPTVLSRCVTIRLKPTPEKELTQVLKERCGADDESALVASRLSGGNAGRALQLLQSEEFASFREEAIGFLRDLKQKNALEIEQYVRQLGENTDLFLDLAECWYRDVCVYKATHDAASLIFQDEVKYSIRSAANMDFRALQDIQNSFAKARLRRSRGGNDAQILEMLLLSVRESLPENA